MTGGSGSDPMRLGESVQQVAERSLTVSSSGKSSNLKSSPALPPTTRCSRADFAKAMAHLCALKRTAGLTDLQTIAWHGVLGGFRAEIVNAAVLELVLIETRFPELGDLYQICRRRAIECGDIRLQYSPHGDAADSKVPSKADLAAIGERLGLKV